MSPALEEAAPTRCEPAAYGDRDDVGRSSDLPRRSASGPHDKSHQGGITAAPQAMTCSCLVAARRADQARVLDPARAGVHRRKLVRVVIREPRTACTAILLWPQPGPANAAAVTKMRDYKPTVT